MTIGEVTVTASMPLSNEFVIQSQARARKPNSVRLVASISVNLFSSAAKTNPSCLRVIVVASSSPLRPRHSQPARQQIGQNADGAHDARAPEAGGSKRRMDGFVA
jgi:hypothetical protein